MEERSEILVVDDEQVILDSTRRILGSEGYRVLTALDAETAQQVIEAEGPDIVISDLVLPGASGMELLETALEQDPTLIIIITTGYSTVENAVAALKQGALDFLPKPFTVDELMSCVDRAHRAVGLRPMVEGRMPGPVHREDYHLGTQAWARTEGDGAALLGVTDFQLQTMDRIERIEFPDVDDELRQGGRLVCLFTTDGLTHNVWSPLGGRVLVCNDRLRDEPELLREDPSGAGWIARVLPGDLGAELANLTAP